MAGAEQQHPGRVLAIDVGSVRIGLATSDETRTVATPLATVPRRSKDLWARLRAELEQRGVATVIVGLPRMLDGSEGAAAADARTFATQLQARIGGDVQFWDERFTTALAERHLVSAGMRRRRRRRSIDAVAAAVLLQSWLDAQQRGR